MNETQFLALKVALGGERTGYGQDIRMSSWLQEVYPLPEVQAAMRVAEMHECVQLAGETMFVPAGWHHAVLNIGDTVALAVRMQHVWTHPASAKWSKQSFPIRTGPEDRSRGTL